MTVNNFIDDVEYEKQATGISFVEYERLCNENNLGSRKNGILSDEIFDDALDDPSTVSVEYKGKNVPVLIDVNHSLGLGYDINRATEYAKNTAETISMLAIPIGDVDEELQRKAIDAIALSGKRAIYFSDNHSNDSAVLFNGLTEHGLEFTETPLLDKRCRVDNRQATLSLYVCDNVQTDLEKTNTTSDLSNVQYEFDTKTLPSIEDVRNASILKNGASFENKDLDEIWDLYLHKFELLGQNHPISMEDSKEDFLELFTDPCTMVSIRYNEGKPVCFTYLTENFDSLYWLNKTYLETLRESGEKYNTVFFPGIVASGAGGNYAEEVVTLFAKHTALAGMNSRIVFENTNLSEMYVPRIIFDAASKEKNLIIGKPQKIDQTTYRLVTI